MGEVYRARDERLEREVAIKVLPADLAGDANRLARFEREAKAVASLSHPNILAIHDFGREDTVTFAVTELIDGDTLEELIEAGGVPQRKAIDYCRQIANGLAAAHDKGVVHRDVKPANVIVNREGRVKILDFGLAKLELVSADTEAPTMAAASGTAPGAVLGTVGYMAPEQVRGLEADHRADIFSLGAILYELLSGQRAFRAESAVEIMSAILKEDPPELSSAVEHLPAGLEGVIQHCLEKNPEERFQSARDLAFALDSVSRVSHSGLRAVEADLPRQKRRLSWIWAAGLALIASLIGVGVGSWLMGSQPEVPPTFQKLSFRRGAISTGRFVPDSQAVIYGASWEGQPLELFMTQIGTPGSRSLDLGATDVLSISDTGELAVSIDRRFVAGFETSGTLARVSLAGGAPRVLLENVHEADWGPDGESLAVAHLVDGRYRLEYPIGEVLFETDGWVGEMRVSPDGQRIAFVDHPVRGDNVGNVAFVDLQGNLTATEIRGSQGLAWRPDGQEVWAASGRTILALSVDGGEVRRVWSGATGIRLLDIDKDGRLLVAPHSLRREMAGRAPGGEEIGLSWFDWSGPRDLSADGRTVLFDEGNVGDDEGYWIFLRGTDGSAPVRIGSGVGVALSPDAEQVLIISYPFTDPKFVLVPVGAGERVEIDVGDIRLQPLAIWQPSGRGFVFAGSVEGEGTRLFYKNLDSGEVRPVTPPGIELNEPRSLSPDGQSVVVRSSEGELTRYPLGGGEPSLIAGAGPRDFPIRFDETGESLYVLQFGGVPSSFFKINLSTGERTLAGELSPADPAGVFDVDKLFMTADGSAYVYSYRRFLSNLKVVEGLE
jgi:Tol biopolymer transport system component